MKKFCYLIALISFFTACKKKNTENEVFIGEKAISQAIDSLSAVYGESQKQRFDKGVRQVAALWNKNDGTEAEFVEFCKNSFINDEAKLDIYFQKLSVYFENIWGLYNKMSQELRMNVDVDKGETDPIDEMFGAYNPSSHLTEDLFANKIAFQVIINFPFYSLKEKEESGKSWTRKQWAYARMGDLFTSRVPAELIMKASEVQANADLYISSYNIFMGKLVSDKGANYFPADMSLITHWGLRDEIKSNYSNKDGLEKQKMIYEVMKRIIDQSIPVEVINSDKFLWNPFTNKLTQDNKPIEGKAENNVRYQHLLNNFLAIKAMDAYNPNYPTYILRSFDAGMELSIEQVENMFVEMCSSEEYKKVAQLISKRLGRPLEPFDIWYDGFKARSSVSADELDMAVKKKYPDKAAFEADLPVTLTKLDFSPDMAKFIASKIAVDASRGAGHAWGAETKNENARLRTRIGIDGMNYKGYNIAVHEFGHNVEQTISLHNVDYYMLHGVPSTAFTEALAFVFQKRDLELLGIKDNNPDKEMLAVLDAFWATAEIMGVSLVDMKVWKWLYENPDANATQLKDAVIRISKEVWNKYFADAFGIKDQTILAVYSHMIDYPLYLSAYPMGHLIEFQLEKQIKNKVFADEILRIYAQGRLIPQLWMMQAVGMEVSAKPMIEAAKQALTFIK